MDEKINKIVDIIKDYREEDINKIIDNGIYNVTINYQHVLKWVSQFDKEDQEFIIDELLHILPKTYLTKENLIKILDEGLEIIAKKFNYDNALDFFEEATFIDNQADNKSQKKILSIIDEILYKKYNIHINDCGKKRIKHWLYFDDVLATGGTFNKDVLYKVAEFGEEDFIQQNIKIYGIFIAVHTLAKSYIPYSLNFTFKGIEEKIKFICSLNIENNPRINKYNPNPKFNHIYPLKTNTSEKILNFINDLFFREITPKHEEFAFRTSTYPAEETFFSSKENRIRFENIILEKSFEIMKNIGNITIPGLRPLGCTNTHYKTLGTGTLFFTWRNISNTCPLVFWWGQNWYPLFPVKGRGR